MGEGEEVSDTKVFSLEEVKKHAKGGSEKEVWMVIHDNVYDVTKFLDEVRGFFQFLAELYKVQKAQKKFN